MFQEVPNSYREAMSSPDKDKWQKASAEEFEGLTEMGIWKLVDVEMEYQEMLFQVETEHSDKELYQIIAQSRPVQMISY